MAKYKDDSIISLNPREFTRLRPSTYLGSNEYSTQLVKEIFSNSLDEHNIGHGNIIRININTNDNYYSVEDEGQGFPINVKRPDNKTVLQAAFDTINTSGKYDDENGVYQGVSIGLNGIGSKLTNFLSTDLSVYSSNGTDYEQLYFKDGIFSKRETEKDKNKKSGTIVKWHPDKQFFQNVNANINELQKLFTEISALCPKLTIELTVDNNKNIYNTPKGIQSLIDNKKEILSNRFYIRKEVDKELFDIVLTYTSDYSETIIPYANFGLTDSGVHISAIKAHLVKHINKYALENNLIKKKDDNFSLAELSEGLYIIFNIKTTGIKYDSQTKSKVVDINRELINQVFNNDFVDWLNNNSKDVKKIIDKALIARKAKEAAQKAKDSIRGLKSKDKKFINLPTKLIDAYSKNRSECELFIVEGDSAMNGLVAKRDGKTQAIFPIRGKIINCSKATTGKIFENVEVNNIVKAIGLELDKKTNKLIYDKNKLRYDKILIATDADEDGFQIRLLLINMFWYLCPELIINGHLYAVVPPLFRITTNKNEYIYLKDKVELNKYTSKHNNYTVGRLKGLGEMSPDESKYCLLNPASRNVQQIIVDNENKTVELLNIFMGSSSEQRKDYLLNNKVEEN
jgi:DNA gyrase/topoisomerase IV subunit B